MRIKSVVEMKRFTRFIFLDYKPIRNAFPIVLTAARLMRFEEKLCGVRKRILQFRNYFKNQLLMLISNLKF
jgi:hypothetical protein